MRVVAGIAKGRRLAAPSGDVTRPTSDFVREAIFNTLGSLMDLSVLDVADLFAGSGAMGIEALSRGAASAAFVDADRRAVAAIRNNLESTGLDGGVVHQADVMHWLEQRVEASPTLDVVFVDPPYAFDGWDKLFERLGQHVQRGESGGLVVAESDHEIAPGEGWEVLKAKRYGSTVVTLTSPRPERPLDRSTRSHP